MELVGTTEAAYLLGICSTRVRQLLIKGRIKGAQKVGRCWQIPLYKGMPKVTRGKRGPAGTWKKRQQQALNRITVNRHKIKKNKDEGNAVEKVISLKKGEQNFAECHYVEINGPSRMVYQPNNPLHCGATVWIEVDPSVKLISKVFANVEQRSIMLCGEKKAA